MDKYPMLDFLPNIVIHNILSICGKMADWGTRDPKRGSRTLPYGWFPCGFNMVGCLGQLHEAG